MKLCEIFVLATLLGVLSVEASVAERDTISKIVHERKLLQDVVGLIQGGFIAVKGRFPYMVSLRAQDNSHACGGVLIDKSWVLSAAHCLDVNALVDGEPLGLNPQVVIGALGITDGPSFEDVEVFLGEATLHPRWDGNLKNGFDIALIKLATPSKLEPVHLAAKGSSLRTGKVLSALGWGSEGGERRLSMNLKWANVIFRRNDQCNLEEVWNNIINPEMMCAGGTLADTSDVCAGDSGGPLISPHSPGGKVENGDPSLDFLVGLTSFKSVQGCGSNEPITSQKPAVYTRVSEFRDWIESVTSGSREEGEETTTVPPAITPILEGVTSESREEGEETTTVPPAITPIVTTVDPIVAPNETVVETTCSGCKPITSTFCFFNPTNPLCPFNRDGLSRVNSPTIGQQG